MTASQHREAADQAATRMSELAKTIDASIEAVERIGPILTAFEAEKALLRFHTERARTLDEVDEEATMSASTEKIAQAKTLVATAKYAVNALTQQAPLALKVAKENVLREREAQLAVLLAEPEKASDLIDDGEGLRARGGLVYFG